MPAPSERRSDGRDERLVPSGDPEEAQEGPVDLSEENQRLQAELERAHDAQIAERQTRDDFLSYSAHEFRTPLTLILGYSQALARRLRGRPEAERDLADLERVIGATRRLSGMVEEMLDVSRIETGRMKLSIGPVSLPEIVQRAVDGFQTETPVRLECEADLPLALADPARAEQVLRILVANALRVTPSEQPVVVKVQQFAQGLRVSVVDSGPIISEGALSRLFGLTQPYPDAVEGRRGLGLGLFIAAGIARGLGGDLRVERASGAQLSGNRFVLTLPRAPGNHAGSPLR